MSFGKRAGWKEGAVFVNGRRRAIARIVKQTPTHIVLQTDEKESLPLLFHVAIDGQMFVCDLKKQHGNEYFASIAPVPEATRTASGGLVPDVDTIGQWSGSPRRSALRPEEPDMASATAGDGAFRKLLAGRAARHKEK